MSSEGVQRLCAGQVLCMVLGDAEAFRLHPPCRSCEAGLQAGVAKFQTLTLFSSRRAVENFIQTHVGVLIMNII